MTHKCIKCGDDLVIGANITQYRIDHSDYRCRKCENVYNCEYDHQTGRKQSMDKNKDCASYLGVHIAEQVLSRTFKNVIRMPYGNPGYDFKCGKGYLVDIKSACRCQRCHGSDNWIFHIRKNQIAQYFLCLAFDNREDLTPEHIWLIPADDVNDKTGVSIAETTLSKWDEYRLDISKIVHCCEEMR